MQTYLGLLTPLPPGQIERGAMLEATIYAALGALSEIYRALLCPTLAITALPVGEDQPDPVFDTVNWSLAPDIAHLMTLPFNICNWCPVIATPSGLGANGVPTGVQIVGRTYLDEDVFEVAAALEQRHPWLDNPARRPAASLGEAEQQRP